MEEVIKILKSEILEIIKQQNPNAANNPALFGVVDEILKIFDPSINLSGLVRVGDEIFGIECEKKSDNFLVVKYGVRTLEYGFLEKKINLSIDKTNDGNLKFTFGENAPLIQKDSSLSQREWYAESNNAELEIYKSGGFQYATYDNRGMEPIEKDSYPTFESDYDCHSYSESGIETYRTISYTFIEDVHNFTKFRFNSYERNNYLMFGLKDLVKQQIENHSSESLTRCNRVGIDKVQVVCWKKGDLMFRGKCSIDFIPEHDAYFQKIDVSFLEEREKGSYSEPALPDTLRDKAFMNLDPKQREALLKYKNEVYYSDLDENYYNVNSEISERGGSGAKRI